MRQVRPALLVTLAVCGCGGGERFLHVSGKITVNHKPLPAGMIVFHPDVERGNRTKQEPRGQITEQGVYQLRCGDRVGAPPGWYRVAIFPMRQPQPGDGMKPPDWLASQSYTDVKTSGLAVEVVESPKAGAYDFDLKP